MIPLTFLCDEYIDRPKLIEQKNPFVYIVPPPPPPHTISRNPPTMGSEQLVEIELSQDQNERFCA